MLSSRTAIKGLLNTIKYNKICYNNGNPYNLRWQYKWRHAYYTYPKDTFEHTRVKKPEDTPEATPLFWTTYQDLLYRTLPHLKLWLERSSRIQDTFQLYVLPCNFYPIFSIFALLLPVLRIVCWLQDIDFLPIGHVLHQTQRQVHRP